MKWVIGHLILLALRLGGDVLVEIVVKLGKLDWGDCGEVFGETY